MSGSPLRYVITLSIIFAAAYAGWRNFDETDDLSKTPHDEQLRAYQEAFARPNTLVVVHHHQPHNASRRMARELAELDQEKYGPEVCFITADVGTLPEEEKRAGIQIPEDPAALSFYFDKQRITSIQGDLSKKQMEDKIDEVSRGLIKRMHKGWLPDVPGMTPRRNPASASCDPDTVPLSVAAASLYSPLHEAAVFRDGSDSSVLAWMRETQGSCQWREERSRSNEREGG